MFRDPIDKAISMYNYVNFLGYIPPNCLYEAIWIHTHRRAPSQWIKDPKVLDWLYEEILKIYLPSFLHDLKELRPLLMKSLPFQCLLNLKFYIIIPITLAIFHQNINVWIICF